MSTLPSSVNTDVSLMAQDQYFREVNWMEPLAPDEEVKLLNRVKRGLYEQSQGCPNQWVLSLATHAREQLIEHYQRLVIRVASSYQKRIQSFELMDLIQEGNIGLMAALDNCERYAHIPFNILAVTCVRNALRVALAQSDNMIRLPKMLKQTLGKLKQVETSLYEQFQREPTIVEVAHAMKLSETKVVELMLWRDQGNVRSFQTLREDDDAEDRVNFISLYEQANQEYLAHQEDLAMAVQQALDVVLTPRQREVIGLRFGVDTDGELLSMQKVADTLGVHANAVFSSEKLGVERLREALVVEGQGVSVQIPECECGCGQKLPSPRRSGPSRRYATEYCRVRARRARKAHGITLVEETSVA